MRILFVLSAGLAIAGILFLLLEGGAGNGGPASPPRADAQAVDARPALVRADVGQDEREPEPGGDSARAEDPALEPAAAPRARLRLFLVDRASGLAATSAAELWQLGLPEDDVWHAGDVRRAVLDIGDRGATVEDLPEGRYRLYAIGRRADTPDPPEFVVRAPETTITLAIDVPRLARLHLDLRDITGAEVESARMSTGYRGLPRRDAPFADERIRKDQPFDNIILMGGGGAGGFRHKIHTRGRLGFVVGTYRERGMADAAIHYPSYNVDGLATVRCDIPGYEGGRIEPLEGEEVTDRVLLAVAPPEDWFDDAVLLPDGTTAMSRGARIYVWGEPRFPAPDEGDDAWRMCTIKVTVKLEGFEEVTFRQVAGVDEPELRVLTPSPQ